MQNITTNGNLINQLHSKFGQLENNPELLELIGTVCETYIKYEGEIEKLKNELEITKLIGRATKSNPILEGDNQVLKERFELFLEATNDAVYDWNIQTGETTMSGGFERLYGENVNNEFNFDIWVKHLHPEDVHRVIDSLENTLEKNKTRWSETYRFLCADGNYKSISERGYIIYENHTAIRMVGVMQDITEITVAQNQLKKGIEFTENLICQANVMIIGLDKDGKIFIFNNEAEKITGYKKEEVIGVHFIDAITSSDDYDKIKDNYKHFLDTGTVFKTSETSLTTKEGTKKIISWQSSEIFDDGKLAGTLSFGIDVTEKQRKDKQLIEQNVALQKANNELDQFVYRASHDMKAPLTSILGLANIIKDETTDEKILPYLELVDKSVENLMGYIRDIIDYSKNHSQIICFSNISFNKLVSNAIEHNRTVFNSDVKIEYQLQQEYKFYSDETRLSLILNNLLSNAIKYSRNEPDSFISIKIESKATGVTIKIEDNGKGIKKAFHDKIFTMFFRGTTERQGSGLGLYIVKEAVNLLSGTIEFTSEENTGSTFTVTLPHFAQTIDYSYLQ